MNSHEHRQMAASARRATDFFVGGKVGGRGWEGSISALRAF